MRLIVQLRMKYGIEISLASIFVEELGHEMPSSTLMDLCQKQNIAYTFEAY